MGVALWELATGVQDSTLKALVADLVPSTSLATAYDLFAAAQGGGALAGGVLAGALYSHHLPALITLNAALQVASLGMLAATLRLRALRRHRPGWGADGTAGRLRGEITGRGHNMKES